MKVFNMFIIVALCCFLTVADDGDNKKPQKNEEQKKEQLRYEQMLKACEEDMAASERIKAQYNKERNIKTEESQDDKAISNDSETAQDKKEEETTELKEEE